MGEAHPRLLEKEAPAQATVKYLEIKTAMVGKSNNPSRCIGLVGKALHENGVEKLRLKQTAGYTDRWGAEAGHVVIFDRGTGRWTDKVFRQRKACGDVAVEV